MAVFIYALILIDVFEYEMVALGIFCFSRATFLAFPASDKCNKKPANNYTHEKTKPIKPRIFIFVITLCL
jgi:hypothetical protein